MLSLVSFDPMLIRPLPPGMRGLNCSMCDKPLSNWSFINAPSFAPVCSLCVLYEVQWKGKSAEDLEELIRSVETEKGVAFEKELSGRLLLCKDADAIISSLALVSRIDSMTKRNV